MSKEIKASVNTIQIVGAVEEINLERKNNQEVELKRGDVTKKATCDVINKKEFKNPSMTVKVVNKDEEGNIKNETILEVEIVTLFNQYSKALDEDGNVIDNSGFKSLETIMNEYKKGTRVQINNSRDAITENGYVGRDENWVSRIQINGQYCSSTNVPDEDRADAKISGVIRKIKEEMKDEEPTGRLFVEFYMFNYKGATYPVELVVDTDLAEDFQDIYNVGDSCQLDVELISRRVGKPVAKVEKAFGRRDSKIVQGYTKTEVSVFGGDPVFEEENEHFVDMDTMKEAMNERDIMIEQKKKDKKEKEDKPAEKKGLGNRRPSAVAEESPF